MRAIGLDPRFPLLLLIATAALAAMYSTALARPAGPQDTAPIERHAIVIGIGDYANPLLPGARYAAADAESVARFLRSPAAGGGGFGESRITVLVGEDATAARVRDVLASVTERADSSAMILLYVTGIRAPDPANQDDLYLLAHDADPRDIAGTGVPMAFINQTLQDAHALQTLVLADLAGLYGRASVQGAGTRLAAPSSGPAPAEVERAFTDFIQHSSGGFVAFTAGEADQWPQEGRKWGGGHGVFTYYLLRGLQGEADAPGFGDNDRVVTLGELMQYTRDRVRRETANAMVPAISLTTYDRFWPMAAVIDR